MSKGGLLLVLVIGFLAGVAGAYFAPSILLHSTTSTVETAAAKESTYDRVMRTGTIRCGYTSWPPLFSKDPNSGQMSGIFYDYVEALGQALHLKIEWAEEVGFGDFPASLEAGRIDAMCSGIWPNSARAREIDFTNSIVYSGIYAYARADDTRFDNKLDAINDPAITIAFVDGETGSVIAGNDFPSAKTLSLPALTDIVEVVNSVRAKKADIFFADPAFAAKYMKENPGQIREVIAPTPIRVFGNVVAIDAGQERFRRMINTATNELMASGKIEKIISKYETVPHSYLRAAPSYIAQ